MATRSASLRPRFLLELSWGCCLACALLPDGLPPLFALALDLLLLAADAFWFLFSACHDMAILPMENDGRGLSASAVNVATFSKARVGSDNLAIDDLTV